MSRDNGSSGVIRVAEEKSDEYNSTIITKPKDRGTCTRLAVPPFHDRRL